MGKRTTQLGEITTIDNNDVLYGVDVSDLTHSPDGTSKKFTKQNLLKEINSRAGDIESDVSELESAVANILNLVYPVGTIYETTSTDLDTTTKMGNYFGGTWEAYGSGRVLVGKSADTEFDTIGETGGAKTHTLSQAEMPSHTHTQNSHNHENTVNYFGKPLRLNSSASGTKSYHLTWGAGSSTYGEISSGSVTATNQNTGGGGAHNNLQPYIVVYRYRRTA